MKENDGKLPKNCRPISEDDFMLIPLLKSFERGVNNFRPNNIADYVKIYHPSRYKRTHTLFALRCRDKVMQPEIMKDEIMVVHPQKHIQLGNILLYDDPSSGISEGRVLPTVPRENIFNVHVRNNAIEMQTDSEHRIDFIGRVISVMGDL